MQSSAKAESTSEGEHFHTRDGYNEEAAVDLLDFTLPISRWTSVRKDDRLLNHLMTLFWTWDNTVEPCLYRPLFEEDLADSAPQDSGPSTDAFCSSFLVNALLALSCVGEHLLISSTLAYIIVDPHRLWIIDTLRRPLGFRPPVC